MCYSLLKYILYVCVFFVGLVAELLNRLSNAAGPQPGASSNHGTQEAAAAGSHPKTQTTEANRSSQSISTTISLLSTLCRGSPTITHVSVLSYFLIKKHLIVLVFFFDLGSSSIKFT